jgi:hypothetical protein
LLICSRAGYLRYLRDRWRGHRRPRGRGLLLSGGDPAGDRDKKVLGVATGDVLADEAS